MAHPLQFEKALEALEHGLIAGRWQPGERVSLQALAQELHISVTPVRDAVNELVSQGILERVNGVGTCVATPSLERLTDIWELRALCIDEQEDDVITSYPNRFSVDGGIHVWGRHMGAPWPTTTHVLRHGGEEAGNVAFVDGHAASLRLGMTCTTTSADLGWGLNECYELDGKWRTREWWH